MKLFKDLNVGCKYTTPEGGAIFMKIEDASAPSNDGYGGTFLGKRNAVVVEKGSQEWDAGTLFEADPEFEVIPLG